MKHVVVDSVVINHSLRAVRVTKARQRRVSRLEGCVLARQIMVGLDPQGGIVDEWKKTAGTEVVEVLLTAWFECGGVFIVPSIGKIPPALARTLKALGFKDTVDKLIVRVALVLKDRIILSEDSDFWNPKNVKSRGLTTAKAAPVAALLRNELGIRVYTMRQFDAALQA